MVGIFECSYNREFGSKLVGSSWSNERGERFFWRKKSSKNYERILLLMMNFYVIFLVLFTKARYDPRLI